MILETFAYVFYKNLAVCVFIIVNLSIAFSTLILSRAFIKILHIVPAVHLDPVTLLVDPVRLDRSPGESLGRSGTKV